MRVKNSKSRFNRVFRLADGVKKCDPGDEKSQFTGCGYVQPKYTKSGLRIIVEHNDEEFDAARDKK